MSGRVIKSHQQKQFVNKLFVVFCVFVTLLSVAALCTLLFTIAKQGWHHLDLDFLTSYASRKPEKAGVKAAMWGTVWLCVVCIVTALPIGVATAVYLEEFAPKNRITRFIELNIANLAGVPSIVYGIIGLTVFARMLGLFGTMNHPLVDTGNPTSFWYFRLPFGSSVLVGGLTLALVVLPIVIVSAREAVRAVPQSLREASLAMGATRWETVRRVVLPQSTPGILTGAILATSRAIGEAAPILVIGGFLFIRFVPANVFDDFTAMPLQIYNWSSRPQEEFHAVAATGIIVLLVVLLCFNGAAALIRYRFQRR
ncbi:MAG: phosphate ABC transporter permease PstA [Planctomycetes bacterium]|nr:phosphate ABC transporter permease PstA [Planctomycetota bacterium]